MKELSVGSYRKIRLLYASLMFFSIAAALWFGTGSTSVTAQTDKTTEAAAPLATFPGTGTGAIPDSPGGTPPVYGTPLVINYAVTGMAAPLTDVSVNMTVTHSWVGDLDVVLRSPGGTAQQTIFSRVGALTATSFGSSSDLSGLYNFTDTATGTNFWTAAAATPVPAGNYRTTAPGPVAASPAPVTNLTTPFAGLSTAQINGTWTLTIRDGGGGDTGSISASNLTLTAAPVTPVDAANDINGDGRSDYTVVRNVGGGANGQIRWFYNTAGTADPTVALDWGLASDGFFLLEDYDGDGKDDITVWRSGTATFYILQSQTMTARIDPFGQTGDDPTIAGDYDGDGKADTAVYRAGAMAGNPSTWYYRGSLTPANVTVTPWGQNGDFPSPGDYDGDGKYDFVIQRNNGGGQAAFWRRNSNGSASVTPFGTPTDVIVPGDYDGDGKCDIATVRGVSGQYQWMYLSSLNSSINYITFGASATDLLAQGDYNGDGRTDVGIWRASATPGGSFYVWRDTASGSVQFFTFGQNGDYPVNNWNRH